MARIFKNGNWTGSQRCCPVCKKKENGDLILVPVVGTEDGNNINAVQVHVKCILDKVNFYPSKTEDDNAVIALIADDRVMLTEDINDQQLPRYFKIDAGSGYFCYFQANRISNTGHHYGVGYTEYGEYISENHSIIMSTPGLEEQAVVMTMKEFDSAYNNLRATNKKFVVKGK